MDKEKVIRELKAFKKRLNSKIKVDQIILFGSIAAGTAGKDSDIDVMIVSPSFNKLNFVQRSARMYQVWTLHEPVDFFCLTPEEFDAKKHRATLVREAVREGVVI